MLPRDVVLKAIERTKPPRVPIHYCNRDLDDSDTYSTGWHAAADFVPSEPGVSEWGFVWHSMDQTMGQPSGHPLADWPAYATYRPPDPHALGRLEHVRADLAANQHRFTRFIIGISGFNTATFIRGFEAFMMDLYEAPERAKQVLDLVYDFENGLIEQLADIPAEIVELDGVEYSLAGET